MNAALLLQFTRQDLVDRYAGSLLGGLWTFIQPVVNMLVFILVFSRIMGARLPEIAGSFSYSIYLISGLLGWIAFSSTLMRTTTVFLDQANIIKKVRVSLWSFPLSIVLSDTVIYAISFAFFLLFLAWIGHGVGPQVLWVPAIFAVQQAFAYSLGLILGALSVFFRDIKETVSVLLQLWFWLTPIVYVATIIPEEFRPLLAWNPMYPVIEAYHSVLLLGQPPETRGLVILCAFVAVLALFGSWMFRRLESDIRDLI